MKNRISALIIDPLKKEHDYSQVKVNPLWDSYEEGFDLKVIKNTDNILKDLHEWRGVDCIITIGDDVNCEPLNKLSFEYRKKWIHKDVFDADSIAYSIIAVFMGNVGRLNPDNNKIFSIFTCTFNTGEFKLRRLYDSLLSQTYEGWNWFILDDSTNDDVVTMVKKFADPRITVYRNYSNHGSIGFNKHSIAMLCNGDYLVEVDHDDELLPNCIEELKKSFETYPDAAFAYSYVLENIDGSAVNYGDEWGKNGWGGGYADFDVKGKNYKVALQADITPISIRTIFTQPNHVRCWEKNFYHRIGGHNTEFSVLDDAEILIRTFLYGKMIKIPKVLYIQHESGERNGNGENTQAKRYKEIQRTSDELKRYYDGAIHNRILELGFNDCIWDHNMGFSNFRRQCDNIPIMNYIYK